MGNSTGVLDRFYSKLSPFMNPGLHSGRDQQEQRNAAKTVTAPIQAETQVEGDPLPLTYFGMIDLTHAYYFSWGLGQD